MWQIFRNSQNLEEKSGICNKHKDELSVSDKSDTFEVYEAKHLRLQIIKPCSYFIVWVKHPVEKIIKKKISMKPQINTL